MLYLQNDIVVIEYIFIWNFLDSIYFQPFKSNPDFLIN